MTFGVFCKNREELKRIYDTFYMAEYLDSKSNIVGKEGEYRFVNCKNEKYVFLIGNESCRGYKFDKIFIDRKINKDVIDKWIVPTLKQNIVFI